MRKELTMLASVVWLAGITSAQAQQTTDTLMPPNAKAGECYARVFVPPRYATRTERVMVEPERERIEYSKPVYEWMTKTRIRRPAYEQLKVTPATLDWVEERVLVKEASEQRKFIPAQYEWVEEKVLVKAAYTTWKKGRGLIERIDDATGEIMCRVEVPAVYKTVKKQALKTPARTEKVAVPAEYRTVKKQVITSAPQTVKTIVPAETVTFKVRKLVSAPEAKRLVFPAKYQPVTKTVRVSDGALEWRSVLCETNAGPGLITQIQRALKAEGFEPGPVDGVVGGQTMFAVTRFQEARKLSTGKLTLETIRALGIAPAATRM